MSLAVRLQSTLTFAACSRVSVPSSKRLQQDGGLGEFGGLAESTKFGVVHLEHLVFKSFQGADVGVKISYSYPHIRIIFGKIFSHTLSQRGYQDSFIPCLPL